MHDERPDKPHGAGKSSFELIESGKLFQILAPKPWFTVLDMGCGTGTYSIAMAKIIGDGGRIHAADLWAEGIERLKERVERRGLKNVRPMVADVSRALPLSGESMDLILMATVLHDLKEAGVQDGALAEARRLLKRHGTFAVVEFNKVPGPPGPPISIRLSPDDVAALVEPFGFARTGLHEVGPHNYLMTFAPKAVCNA
jgi:ubiquinone/menaquinone biosynthesis C-methylase UbiE